jgi:hypothetical protein
MIAAALDVPQNFDVYLLTALKDGFGKFPALTTFSPNA